MGCYGDTYATTPNVDALAAKGMLFKRAWSCGPVCAAARTTIIAGMYPPSTGGEHMRSMTQMPKGTKMYPQFLREAGYYCTNNSKEDYNLAKARGRVGRVVRQRPLEEPQGLASPSSRSSTKPAATKASSANARTRRFTIPQRCACPLIIPTRRKSARIGRSIMIKSRWRTPPPANASKNSKKPVSPLTRSFSTTPTTAAACRATSAGPAIPASRCRWSCISRQTGNTSRRRNTARV
jgi:hypothetical protein